MCIGRVWEVRKSLVGERERERNRGTEREKGKRNRRGKWERDRKLPFRRTAGRERER